MAYNVYQRRLEAERFIMRELRDDPKTTGEIMRAHSILFDEPYTLRALRSILADMASRDLIDGHLHSRGRYGVTTTWTCRPVSEEDGSVFARNGRLYAWTRNP